MLNKVSSIYAPRLANRIDNPLGHLCKKAAKTFSYIGEGFMDDEVVPFYDAQAVCDIPDFATKFIDNCNIPNNFYTSVLGDSYLLNVLSIQAKKLGIPFCNKENILVTAGAVNAFSGLCYALCDVGDVILTLSPSYILFANTPETYGAELVLVPSEKGRNKFIVQPEVLEQYVLKMRTQNKNIKALLIINPTNIDGQCWCQEEIKKIAPIIRKYNLLVIEDRVYDKLQYDDENKLQFFGETKEIKNQVITINSVSKRYGATQWRIGWVYAPKDIIDASAQYLMQSVWSPNLKFQRAAALMLATDFDKDELKELSFCILDNDFLETVVSSKHESQKYFDNIKHEYQLRRDLCLYIINGKAKYSKLKKEYQFLMPPEKVLGALNIKLEDFDITGDGIKGFDTPIVPVATMFLLAEANEEVFGVFKDNLADKDLLLARIFYKEIKVVMLPPSELTLPEEYMYFRMEFGIDMELLLTGLSRLQKFMNKWLSLSETEVKKIVSDNRM